MNGDPKVTLTNLSEDIRLLLPIPISLPTSTLTQGERDKGRRQKEETREGRGEPAEGEKGMRGGRRG